MYVCVCVYVCMLYTYVFIFIFIYGLLLAPLLTIVVLQAYFLVNIVITLIVAIGYPQHLALQKIWT